MVLPTSSLQMNSEAVFGQLHTTDPTVAPVQLQNAEMAEGSLSVFGFRWHYGRNNGHYNSTVRHRNDVAKHSKDAEIKFKTEASKDNTEMQMHRDKLVANLESSRQAAVDKCKAVSLKPLRFWLDS